MSNLVLVTYSGSKYHFDIADRLYKNGELLISPNGNQLIYVGLANSFKFNLYGNILPEFFDYEAPEGIKSYLANCPSKETIILNLKDGMVQAYMVRLVAMSTRQITELKKEFQIEAESTKEFIEKFKIKVEKERPEGKVALIPYNYITTVITHCIQE